MSTSSHTTLFPGIRHTNTVTRRPLKKHTTTLELCVLGSGSGGNSTVVRSGDAVMLIDVGFGPVTIARRLAASNTTLEHVRAILLTHLDQDHFRPAWIQTLARWKIPLFLHRWQVPDLHRHDVSRHLENAGLIHIFDREPFEPLPKIHVEPVSLPHDRQGTSGFLVQSAAGRIGYATDLGHVPSRLLDCFSGVDLLAIESNYDPEMQRSSPRPTFVKRRIMGRLGHLSNAQAFEAVRQITERSPQGRPQHIVLLHRSQRCNEPRRVLSEFDQDPQISRRVTLTHQRRRSRWFKIRPLPPIRYYQLNWQF